MTSSALLAICASFLSDAQRAKPGVPQAFARLRGWYQHQILFYRHAGKFVRYLKGAQQTKTKELVRAPAADVFSIQQYLPGGGRQCPSDDVE